MSDEPRPVSESVGPVLEKLERLRAAQPEEMRERDGSERPEDRAAQIEAERESAWARICPPRLAGASLESLDHPPEALGRLRAWAAAAAEGSAENLLLFGLVGRGKSFAALACCKEAHMREFSVLFEPVVELLDRLRPEGGGSLDADLAADLLILDDLGGERPTEWTAERLYLLVNRRWLDRRPIVATSNVEPAVLKDAVGERTYDRLREDATVLRLGGAESRRGGA